MVNTRRVALATLTTHLTDILITVKHKTTNTTPPARTIYAPRHRITPTTGHAQSIQRH